jgi:hypothetical protein
MLPPMEFGDQRLQVPLVRTPAAEAAGVDRLANLGAADRAHPAVALKKTLAGWVIRQVEKSENAAEGAGKIRDPVLEPRS